MGQRLTVADDAVQASVLAGAFHAAMFFVAAGAFLLFGLPRAAGGAALLGLLLWVASLLHWALAHGLARFTRWRRAPGARAPRREVSAAR